MTSALGVMAFMLPLAGIALGWWSFRWTEEGAMPDTYADATSSNLQLEEAQLRTGQRYRARWCSRTCFNTGALFLAASVPMGSAANAQNGLTLSAISALLIIAFTAIYVASQLWRISQHRREDAFSIYFHKDMFFLYHKETTRGIYFRLNPMRIWTLPDRHWFQKRKLPSIDEVYATASKTNNLTVRATAPEKAHD